jgi:iron complex transport system ATP-binding protein
MYRGSEEAMAGQEVLQARKLEIGYGMQGISPILHDVDIGIAAGEMVGIIGANGAGKSTLLKTLRGILPRLDGDIILQGKTIDDYTEREFARQAAYLQQGVPLTFGYTAYDIAMTGRYPYLAWWQHEGGTDRHIIEACMRYTGVWELARHPFASLSGGQRQRVLLAKVLIQQTPLLFLDEPATGLDLIYQEEIFRFCRELCAVGKTTLMVVHELSLAARFCSRLLLLGKGRIMADGKPEAVLTAFRLAQAYGRPIKVATDPCTGHMDIFTEPASSDRHHQHLLQIVAGTGAK